MIYQKIALTLLLPLFLNQFANASQKLVAFTGEISKVWIGEIDPFIVGEACLIEVKTNNGMSIGLLTGYDDCVENQDELIKNRGLTVVLDLAQKISDPAIHQTLKYINAESQVFYRTEFGTIENGLSDLLDQNQQDEVVVIKGSTKARYMCTFGHGDFAFKVALSLNPFLKPGYDLSIVKIIENGSNQLITQEGIVSVKEDSKNIFFTLLHGTMTLQKESNSVKSAYANIETNKLVIKSESTDCKMNTTIEFEEQIVLQPRFTVGN